MLSAIDAERPDAIYCLGDLVGYGAFPNETTALIASRGIPTIMGNYDDGVGFDRDDCGCAYKDADEKARGQQSLMWTRAVDNRRQQGVSAFAAARNSIRSGRSSRPLGPRQPAPDE